MAEKKSLKKNFLMNIVLTVSSFIFPFITFPYASRILQADGMGKVSFATSLISYFTLFSQLGVPTYGIRICSGVRDDKEMLSKTVHELLILRLITTLISYAALVVALITVPKLQSERTLYIIVSFNIVFTFIGVEWLYKALEQYTYITIRSIIFKFVALVAPFVLVHKKEDYVIYGGITILAASASNIFNFINLRRFISFKKQHNYNIKQHLKPVLVFFAMACATTIYTHLDTLMLGFMKTDADVGYYTAAVKIKGILVSIVTSLGAVLLPRCSYYIKNNMIDEFKRISRKSINFVFIIAVPLVLYFIMYAMQGILILSGDDYLNAVIPMQIIMPTLIFIGITNLIGMQMLVPMGKEKWVLISEIFGAVTDLILNIILIPKFASSGAAIGTLAAEAVVMIVQLYAIHSDGKSIGLFGDIHFIKVIMAAILGAVASVWVLFWGLGSVITVIITGILFFGVYFLILLIIKETLVVDILNQMLKKIKISWRL